MHNMNSDKMHREKARWELRKNALHTFEQMLEAAPHKKATAQLPAFYLTNHSSKIHMTFRALLNNQGGIH